MWIGWRAGKIKCLKLWFFSNCIYLQVVKAVSAAFKAYEVSQKKTENQNLFDDEPEPVNLLVSAIKIPQGEPVFFST